VKTGLFSFTQQIGDLHRQATQHRAVGSRSAFALVQIHFRQYVFIFKP